MDLRRHCTRSTRLGSLAWIAWVALAGQPLLVDLFLLSPLVLASLVLRLVLADDGEPSISSRVATVAQLPAALVGAASFLVEPGPTAAALTLPWLGVTVAMATHAAIRVRRRRSLRPVSALAIDAALAFVVVGGGWWWVSRAGLAPLGFSPTIVFLTAVHFHFAGFGLPMLAGLVLHGLGGASTKAAAMGVVLGVPLVAAGITFSPPLELAGAAVTVGSALWIGLAQIRYAAIRAAAGLSGPQRRAVALLTISGLCVTVGMGLAAVYAIGHHVHRPWPSIPQMISTHGAVNALGFCLLGLWGWNLEHGDDEHVPSHGLGDD